MNQRRWNLLPPATDSLAREAGLPPLITQLLYNRGLTEPGQMHSFIAADGALFSADPFLLPDMDRAVHRVYQALLAGENIAVFGDFDADGITATAVVVQGLTALGARAVPYIPDRASEGYGLTQAALEKLRHQGVSLVITVDCGITNVAPVRAGRKLGLDIIITDHHTPLPELPPANAVVNPKLPGSNYPFPELAGVGVAYKMVEALFLSTGHDHLRDTVLDLAAIGTIADMSPLLGENRWLVKEGLRLINASPRLGLRELSKLAGLNPTSLDAEKISWVIGPCLNAAGRLAHALPGYELLMTGSPERAAELADWLTKKNAERQRLTTSTLAAAREQVMAGGISPLLIAGDGGYPVGIAGLVAGRLTEEFYRPAIILRTGEKMSRGSCRSIPEFNIVAALGRCSHLLAQFGGHSQAAGFTTPTSNLPLLKQELATLAAVQLDGIDLRPRLDIDAAVTFRDMAGGTFRLIQQLAPFGQGNPQPAFLSRGVEVADCCTMGGNGDHLRFKLRQGGIAWTGVGFRLGRRLDEVASPLDIVYNLEVDRWNGTETLRLNVLDFARAGEQRD